MDKHAIRLYNNDHEAHFIFHATPNLSNYTWQWYLTDKKDTAGSPIDGQHHESFPITTESIIKRGYSGLYLYCEYTDRTTHQTTKTEYIQLHADSRKMLDSSTIFNTISSYDENGMIV